jgi:hypothetical protein
MHLFMFLFVAVLFFVLTPGIVLSLPPKGSKTVVALTHAIVFALIWTLIHKTVWNWGIATGWIKHGGHHHHHMIEGITFRQCRDNNGTYTDGICKDSSGKVIN